MEDKIRSVVMKPEDSDALFGILEAGLFLNLLPNNLCIEKKLTVLKIGYKKGGGTPFVRNSTEDMTFDKMIYAGSNFD